MRYLMREGSLFSDAQWANIDKAVVEAATKILVGRRFLSLVGPLGARTQSVVFDSREAPPVAAADYWGAEGSEPKRIVSRRFIPLATVYSDFVVSWRDVEDEDGAGVRSAFDAASVCAKREDELIFLGDKTLGIDGIFTAKGVHRQKLSDWATAENPVADTAKAVETLVGSGCTGERALIMSSDLYAKLHRIQPGTGLLEIDRLKSLVGGGVFQSPALGKSKAALVYCDPQNMDLVVGQDLITAYMGNDKMDHLHRVMETLTPRLKRPEAVVVME